MNRFLLISIISCFLGVSCSKESPAPSAGGLVQLIGALPTEFAGWELHSQSRGSSAYGQSHRFTIKLNGVGPGQAVEELRSAIEAKLGEKGFHVVGRGLSGSGSELNGFSITVTDSESAANLVVSAAKINNEEMVAVLAVAQIGKTSESGPGE